ncbi:hypothetical protein SE23_09095 [Vibrio sinaloensis]|uniref:hypothetical protein n=1 Tax=Photobacterium sp. (strain ATCC 43367) TaxID=379097 RepID=UPI00057CD2D5|nr:hypothetical protein [Vibrio sinaloensis]KIE20939.1 hypothetical protein SE23_09095 [Vibrio sinaloensis]
MFDFVSGVATGVAGNLATKLIEAFWGSNKLNSEPPEPSNDEEQYDDSLHSAEHHPKLFETFHIKNGFKDILNYVDQPVVHAIVEDSPTTHYHLITLVIECQNTGEWFVSQKGEMAFEGGGGGIRVARNVIELCAERRVKVTPWVLNDEKAELLSSGRLLWHDVKQELIPLLTYAKSEYFINRIAKRYRELTA